MMDYLTSKAWKYFPSINSLTCTSPIRSRGAAEAHDGSGCTVSHLPTQPTQKCQHSQGDSAHEWTQKSKTGGPGASMPSWPLNGTRLGHDTCQTQLRTQWATVTGDPTLAFQGEHLQEWDSSEAEVGLRLNFVNRAQFSSILGVPQEKSPRSPGDGGMEGYLF